MQRFRGGLVFKAHRLCVSLNSRLESNKEEEEDLEAGDWAEGDATSVAASELHDCMTVYNQMYDQI